VTSQKEVNKKIYTAPVDQYFHTFPNSGWPENLIQDRTTCQETPHNISVQSNGRIENYDYYRKTGQLRVLR
jgi:hypothetical protein